MKLLFGSIIVKGAGRINGHVVRNFRGMPLLTRLALPTRTNAFNGNPQLNIATASFKYWSILDTNEKESWNEIATQIPFKDRWGNTKYLSGRELTSYLYINLMRTSGEMISPLDFLSEIPSFELNEIVINVSEGKFIVSDFINNGGNRQMLFLKLCINDNRNYNEKQLKFVYSTDIESSSASELYNGFTERGIVFQTGKKYAIGIKNISGSGMASPMQIFYVTAV
jgi:hypothetical protein